MYEFFFDLQRWILLCLLLIKSCMNWLAIVKPYREDYVMIILMVYCTDTILISDDI